MAIDPAIEAVFGPAPANVDLNESSVRTNNSGVIAMMALAAAAVITRFVSRIVCRNPILADDYIIVLALVSHCHEAISIPGN